MRTATTRSPQAVRRALSDAARADTRGTSDTVSAPATMSTVANSASLTVSSMPQADVPKARMPSVCTRTE